MKKYLQLVDSIQPLDSTEDGFRLYRAYVQNDTDLLKRSYSDLTQYLKEEASFKTVRCKPLNVLSTLGFDEAYRFDYGAAFCDKRVVITIGKRENNYVLQVMSYQVGWRRDSCTLILNTERQIGSSEWNRILNELSYDDFWGLKYTNGKHGLDGSGLSVSGYQKAKFASGSKSQTIYRWAAEESAIGKTFKNLLHLARVNVKCFPLHE